MYVHALIVSVPLVGHAQGDWEQLTRFPRLETLSIKKQPITQAWGCLSYGDQLRRVLPNLRRITFTESAADLAWY